MILLPFILAFLPTAQISEDVGLRRVRAHILIDDPQSAIKEAANLIDAYPESESVAKAFIETLAFAKKEEEALRAFDHFSLKYPGLIQDRHVLEEMAWGILKKGLDSSQNGIRLSSLIGAYLTRDVKTVSILKKMMSDSNAVIRSVSTQMCSSYGDSPLKDEVARMMKEEKIWMVRLQAIKAIGSMRIKELSGTLKTIIQSEKITYEERQLAIQSFLNIHEKIALPEWEALSKSNRAGMRHLAACIALHFEIDEAKEGIEKLIYDTHPDVRIAALNAFGQYYRFKSTKEEGLKLIQNALEDSHSVVAITAAWASLLLDSEMGTKALGKWLNDSFPENRRLAAAAINASGIKGKDLALSALNTHEDPYVRANLALGLIGQRIEVKKCCDEIYSFMQEEKRMWMWNEELNPMFRFLSPSGVRYIDHIPNYPEAIDQMTRLNLFSLLAIMEDERAPDALKSFLQKRNWGISGVAAATLMQEGDDTALNVVKKLLDEEDPDIQLQACLVLAMLGKDPTVLPFLQGAYATSDHDRKLHILEALGHLGSINSAPFLLTVFKEPFPILRIAAAASLIQCLNR